MTEPTKMPLTAEQIESLRRSLKGTWYDEDEQKSKQVTDDLCDQALAAITLEQRIAELERDDAAVQRKFRDMSREISHLKMKKGRAHDQMVIAQAKSKEEHLGRKSAEHGLRGLQQRAEAAESALKAQTADLKAKLAAAEKEVDRVTVLHKGLMKAADERADAAERKLPETEQRIAELERNLDVQTERISDLKKLLANESSNFRLAVEHAEAAESALKAQTADLKAKLAAAENTLELIIGGATDPSFVAAKYWGGYEQFDAARAREKEKSNG